MTYTFRNYSLFGAMAALAATGGVYGGNFGRYTRPAPPKQPRKCFLPDCQRMTLHNGGYCCAEHKKKHDLIK